jgi:hypothetical protein
MKNEQSRDTGNTGVKTQSEIKLIRKKQHRKLKNRGEPIGPWRWWFGINHQTVDSEFLSFQFGPASNKFFYIYFRECYQINSDRHIYTMVHMLLTCTYHASLYCSRFWGCVGNFVKNIMVHCVSVGVRTRK